MKLPSMSFLKKKEKPEYFLALVLRNEQVNAVIFEELAGKIQVVGKQKEYFKNSIEEVPIEELLEVLDKAISTAEQSLPNQTDTIKTIFGVKKSWVEENKIKKDYLLKLKKVSDELGLIPIGFIVIFEAIAHLLTKEEGAPVSAILVELGKKSISVALVRAGKIIETETSHILETPTSTVDSLLKTMDAEVLPARVIIFDEKDEDKIQEFINYRWGKSLPFLHLPQVTALPSEFDARAVLFGAALQMGFEVLEESHKIPESFEKDEEETKPAEYFGFVEDKDVAKEPLLEKKEPLPEKEEEQKIIQETGAGELEIPEEKKPEETQKKKAPVREIFLTVFENLKKIPFKRIPFKQSLSLLPKGRLKLLIPLAVVVIIIILFYIFIPQANVLIAINPKINKQSQDVVFSASSSTDPAKGIIASNFTSISEDGSVSTNATGKKEVGTNAKGTVTIFNNSTNTQTLSSGTIINSANGLEFTLDKTVSVASASGDIFTGTTPGKSNVSVTAAKIGVEYNLPSNTKFSVEGNNSVAAKNDNPFSGGTKKEITVVSKDDVDKLLEELPKNLEQKAKDDLSKKIPQDKILLPIFISTKIVNKNTDKNVGDEASNLSLKGTVEYQGIYYTRNDIALLANSLFKTSISNNLFIDPSEIKVDVKDLKQKNNKDVSANVTIQTVLKPKIDETRIKKDIAGKSIKGATDNILKMPEVSNVDIKLSGYLPLLPKKIPILEKNIKITTKVND